MRSRRIGRPRLIGTVARTAVIAGTASAASGAVHRRQMARAQEQRDAAAFQREQEYLAAQHAAAAQVATAAHAAHGGEDLISKVEQLGRLHASGALTDDEFTRAKAMLLG